MPFNLNSLANVIFLIISTHSIIYLFLVVGFIEEFKCLVDFIIAY
jgi:hypothetical protein